MDNDHANRSGEMPVPLFGGIDEQLRADKDGEFLARCLDLLQDARSEMTGPARADAAYRHERNLMDGALCAADQVLRSVWAGFHPRPAARGPVTPL